MNQIMSDSIHVQAVIGTLLYMVIKDMKFKPIERQIKCGDVNNDVTKSYQIRLVL